MAPKATPALTPEEELDAQIDELLAAINSSRKAAALAYEFSHGSAYAYGAVQACTKAAMLAKRILGDGQNWVFAPGAGDGAHAAARRGAEVDGQVQAAVAGDGEEGEDEAAMTRRGNTEASKIRNALPLSVRDDKILAMRIAYAVRNVNRYGEVTLELDTARALLARVSPPVELEESEDPDT